MREPSLRRRLVLAVVGLTSGLVLLAGIGTWIATRTVLLSGVDQELMERAERLRRLEKGPLRTPQQDARMRADTHRILQAYDPDGRERARTGGVLDGEHLWDGSSGAVDGPMMTRPGHGRLLRVAVVRCRAAPPGLDAGPDGSDMLVVATAVDLSIVNDELIRLGLALVILWLVVTILAAVAAVALGATILDPLHRLTRDLERLSPEDLSGRVGSGLTSIELQPVVGRLNAVLEGLEQAVSREQATIAYLAHELRTPVAELRTAIEFRLLAAPPQTEQALLEQLLETVLRMQEMAGNLLLLARLESGRAAMPEGIEDVMPVVEEAVDRWNAQAETEGRIIIVEASVTTTAAIAAAHLDIVLDNLLGNALSHGRRSDPIRVEVTRMAGMICIAIVNGVADAVDTDGLGIPFRRGDPSRSAVGHAGLGLALCRRIARLYRGRLDLRSAAGQFRVEVRLPVVSSGDNIG